MARFKNLFLLTRSNLSSIIIINVDAGVDRLLSFRKDILSGNMVRIRLSRVGRKGIPNYRIVVVDRRAPRDGQAIDVLGHYNPLPDPEMVVIDGEKAARWLKQGAQPTAAVARLLSKQGVK